MGLTSLPFGVFIYTYSRQLLLDVERFPLEVTRDAVLFSGSSMAWMEVMMYLGGALSLAGVGLTTYYALEFAVDPDQFRETEDLVLHPGYLERESLRRFSYYVAAAASALLMVSVTLIYLPAMETLEEYVRISSAAGESGPDLLRGVLEGPFRLGSMSIYELAVFRRAAGASLIALSLSWMVMAGSVYVASTWNEEEPEPDGTWYCLECGTELESPEEATCPDCSIEETHLR